MVALRLGTGGGGQPRSIMNAIASPRRQLHRADRARPRPRAAGRRQLPRAARAVRPPGIALAAAAGHRRPVRRRRGPGPRHASTASRRWSPRSRAPFRAAAWARSPAPRSPARWNWRWPTTSAATRPGRCSCSRPAACGCRRPISAWPPSPRSRPRSWRCGRHVPVVGVIAGMVGCFGGMSLAAALCSTLIVTRQARLGMNGPEVIEQEAGIEELDSSDRKLIWSLIGGEQRAGRRLRRRAGRGRCRGDRRRGARRLRRRACRSSIAARRSSCTGRGWRRSTRPRRRRRKRCENLWGKESVS